MPLTLTVHCNCDCAEERYLMARVIDYRLFHHHRATYSSSSSSLGGGSESVQKSQQ